MPTRTAEALLWLFGIFGTLGAGVACATSAPRSELTEDLPPLGKLELRPELSLAAEGGPESGGLGHEIAAEVRLTPLVNGEWTLLSQPAGEHQGGLLEVSLSWKDFVGTSPSSFGRSLKTVRAFGEDLDFSAERPLSRLFRFDVPLPEARILARRVSLSVRLHPVDIRGVALRTGGSRIDFPVASLETYRRDAATPFAELAADADPEELFLAAAQVTNSLRSERVGEVIARLDATKGPQREAFFGALQFLTGITQGRSVARWEDWWMRQSEE